MNRETQNGLWARIERVRRNLTSDEARLEQILEQTVQAEEKPTNGAIGITPPSCKLDVKPTPKQTVYVVVESSWGGYGYSADDATVFTTKEEAEKYEKWLNERFKADTSTIIVETEIETKFEKP